MAARFREKGATSPDRAMTAQELGLPPRFEEAMKRRLGATGVFVEVSGKYYLDEARLQQFEQRGPPGSMGGMWPSGGNMIALRMARMIVAVVAIGLLVANILFLESDSVRIVIALLFVVWIGLTVYQIFYLNRRRSQWNTASNNTAQ
jgi:hypothetical protein